MNKKLIFSILILTLGMVLFSSCVASTNVVVFTSDGEVFETGYFLNPTQAVAKEIPVKTDHIFKEWKFVGVYENRIYIYEAVWEHEATLHSITLDILGRVVRDTAVWGSIYAPSIPQSEIFDFEKWIDVNGEEFDFSAVITGDISVVAVMNYNTDKAARFYINQIDALSDSLFGENPLYFYSDKEYNEAIKTLEGLKEGLFSASCVDQAEGILNRAVDVLNALESYGDKLTAFYNSINFQEYYEEAKEAILNIYTEALAFLTDYSGETPYPQFVLDNAIQQIEAVYTIEEDNDAAENIKVSCIRYLVAYTQALILSDEAAARVQIALDEGIEAIENAQGTKAVGQAYANALKAIKDIENA